jgi:hypothetical protein
MAGFAAACAADGALGPTSLVFYGLSTVYFETDQEEVVGEWT